MSLGHNLADLDFASNVGFRSFFGVAPPSHRRPSANQQREARRPARCPFKPELDLPISSV